MSRIVHSASSLVLAVFALSTAAATQPAGIEYGDLPADVRKHVEEVRRSCTELVPDSAPVDGMQGISVIDLDGDGSQDVMVDNRDLCKDHMAGANCSNRGCDLVIWKQGKGRSWSKVFDEHLHGNFVSVDAISGRFHLLIGAIYAGDKRCEPPPGVDYMSSQSCDVVATYDKGKWTWQTTRSFARKH